MAPDFDFEFDPPRMGDIMREPDLSWNVYS